MKLLYRLFLVVAICSFIFTFALIFQRYNPTRLQFDNLPQAQTSQRKSLVPNHLDIPSLHLSVPIYPARITHSTWETTDNGVSYLMTSVLPGDKGNSILYGHNFTNILGKLPNIKPGDHMMITMTNGEKRTFITDKTAIVDPSDDSILTSSSDPSLTIYTCTGFLDSKRFVVKAIPLQS